MERWSGKVALVTGASRGIGAAICKFLAGEGLTVVGLARQMDKVDLSEYSSKKGTLVPMNCDITQDEDVERVFKEVVDKYEGVDICINNAATCPNCTLLDASPEEWRSVLDVNVVAMCLCTNLAVKSMEQRKTEGQIINISSLSGHVMVKHPMFHMYSATKHAVKAICEGLRMEFTEKKLDVRISCISPGLVSTYFIAKPMGMSENELDQVFKVAPALEVDDVVQCVKFILSSPLKTEVNDILIRPKGSPE